MIDLRIFAGILATAVLIIAGGCASSVSTFRYPNVPDFPPTDSSRVQILRSEPARPHQRLAEITVEAPANTAPAMHHLEEELRTAGAKLGADAVVLVVDPLQPVGVASRAWWGVPIAPLTGRDVIAVAIKYR